MAVNIPQEVNDFFAAYPNALDVYLKDDGVTYLNHFGDLALKEAKQQKKPLYLVQSNLSYTLVWPATLEAELVYNAATYGISIVRMDGSEVATGSESEEDFMIAFDQVVNDIGLEGGVEVSIGVGDIWTITSELNGNPLIEVVDDSLGAQVFTFTTKPIP